MADTLDRARWTARPGWSRALRVVVFLGPIAASLAAAWAVTRALPPTSGALAWLGHLALLVLVSTAVLWVVDRGGRRILPLVTLLELTMLFPQAAPSRMRVARDAVRRRPLEEQLRRVRDAGGDPRIAATEILSLVAALSSHDRPTRGHAERVRLFTDLIAEEMRLPQRDRDLLRWAAILHDIGKLRIPVSVLNKPGPLNPVEWTAMKAHPAHGNDIAAAMIPWLGEWGGVILEHHERWDGTGYPRGLAARDICLGARIVSVADAFDVMTSARAYRRPVSRAAAYRELVRFSGTQFDPTVVRAMVSLSAPRLRRAQGLLAWLADIPLVAGNVVPAATLARVVGAGVVASGAVASGVVPVPAPTPAPAAERPADETGAGLGTLVRRELAPRSRGTGTAVPKRAKTDKKAAPTKKPKPTAGHGSKPPTASHRPTAPPKTARPTPPPKPTAQASGAAGGSSSGTRTGSGSGPAAGSGSGGSAPSGSGSGAGSGAGSGSSGGGGGKAGTTLGDTLDGTVGAATGTADSVTTAADGLVGRVLGR